MHAKLGLVLLLHGFVNGRGCFFGRLERSKDGFEFLLYGCWPRVKVVAVRAIPQITQRISPCGLGFALKTVEKSTVLP